MKVISEIEIKKKNKKMYDLAVSKKVLLEKRSLDKRAT
jgi:hypothetical protein